MKNSLEEIIKEVTEYYKETNSKVPSTVTEYMSNYLKGYSRQVIKSKTGLTCGAFLTLIGSDYKEQVPAYKKVQEVCANLDLRVININETYRSKDRVETQCILCGYKNNTTLDSLRGSKLGCRKCKSGNASWSTRREELEKIISSRLNGVLIGDIPDTQIGYVMIKCNQCLEPYQTQLVGVVSPNSKLRATCPNCRDTDRRVTHEGQTFGSTFELECYKILKPLNPSLHIKYKSFMPTDRRWVCDFKIGDHWIEVSNFKTDYKGYFSNIKQKRDLVESNNFNFYFFQSLKEVTNYFNYMYNKI